jgi:hypothetical protein
MVPKFPQLKLNTLKESSDLQMAKFHDYRLPFDLHKRSDFINGSGSYIPKEGMRSSKLFEPLTLRGGVTLKNRIVVSPMYILFYFSEKKVPILLGIRVHE